MLNRIKILSIAVFIIIATACVSTFNNTYEKTPINTNLLEKKALEEDRINIQTVTEKSDFNELIMSILTSLLVLVGIAQVMMLISQKRQNQLALLQEYRSRWNEYRRYWAIVVFVGRGEDEYYQVASKSLQSELSKLVRKNLDTSPSVWALESISYICNTLSDVCLRILQGQLNIKDVYPLFGSELLRHSRPFRVLLDVYYDCETYDTLRDETGRYRKLSRHEEVRRELQDWLIYHDGIRRRCLILIDLLWAEATRLEDLSPSDIEHAAYAKEESGKVSRVRLTKEIRKTSYLLPTYRAFKLTTHLKNSEFKTYKWQIVGIDREKIKKREAEWVNMLLRKKDMDC